MRPETRVTLHKIAAYFIRQGKRDRAEALEIGRLWGKVRADPTVGRGELEAAVASLGAAVARHMKADRLTRYFRLLADAGTLLTHGGDSGCDWRQPRLPSRKRRRELMRQRGYDPAAALACLNEIGPTEGT